MTYYQLIADEMIEKTAPYNSLFFPPIPILPYIRYYTSYDKNFLTKLMFIFLDGSYIQDRYFRLKQRKTQYLICRVSCVSMFFRINTNRLHLAKTIYIYCDIVWEPRVCHVIKGFMRYASQVQSTRLLRSQAIILTVRNEAVPWYTDQ